MVDSKLVKKVREWREIQGLAHQHPELKAMLECREFMFKKGINPDFLTSRIRRYYREGKFA